MLAPLRSQRGIVRRSGSAGTARFGRAREAGPTQLQAFSRALPLFLLIAVATGVAPVAARLEYGLSEVYFAVLGLKLAIPAATAGGSGLRRPLRRTLGTEAFFAALLLLAAALLTHMSRAE